MSPKNGNVMQQWQVDEKVSRLISELVGGCDTVSRPTRRSRKLEAAKAANLEA